MIVKGEGGRWAVNAAGLLAVVQLEGKFPWNFNDFPRGKGLVGGLNTAPQCQCSGGGEGMEGEGNGNKERRRRRRREEEGERERES